MYYYKITITLITLTPNTTITTTTTTNNIMIMMKGKFINIFFYFLYFIRQLIYKYISSPSKFSIYTGTHKRDDFKTLTKQKTPK